MCIRDRRRTVRDHAGLGHAVWVTWSGSRGSGSRGMGHAVWVTRVWVTWYGSRGMGHAGLGHVVWVTWVWDTWYGSRGQQRVAHRSQHPGPRGSAAAAGHVRG
eukprot:886238-Prymnesium_polylepis.1